ncbi:SDR family NAD(P)-dependent oxidoreductase [Paenibacillus sp. H1-7]|uniref:SDR family oxidoreductase n=1 Tax=Paenibacillus sp. H1-7 TaxID=2282849 RepID=UPI001EF8DD56|nr:SDR family oxidoreductase [Paenibacillus sp. H1-7]ULL13247.1 SDR family NAD(P)-dependent oxidoreductase [Paenibacillus sp. H1-7]
MKKLMSKSALVTGASRGIGRSIALRLAKDGAVVAVHYGSNAAAAEDTVREIRAGGGTAFAVGADLSSVEGIHTLFEALDASLPEHTGSNRLDIIVNNAGIGQTLPIEETTEQSLDEVMNLHLKAPLFIIQQALPRLNDEGRIINISSAVTRIAFPGLLAYSVSKGAVNTLTHVLAQQLGNRRITVNAILPGIIDTEMNAGMLQNPDGQSFAAGLSTLGRWGQPEDVADIAAFLASPDSRWITGQLLDASGGSRL